jgi:hypothetical protein
MLRMVLPISLLTYSVVVVGQLLLIPLGLLLHTDIRYILFDSAIIRGIIVFFIGFVIVDGLVFGLAIGLPGNVAGGLAGRKKMSEIAEAAQFLDRLFPQETKLLDPQWVTPITRLREASQDAARFGSPLGRIGRGLRLCRI